MSDKPSLSKDSDSRASSPHHKPRDKRQADARNRALHVLARMRRGESLSHAARSEHVKPSTVRKYVGRQLRRAAPGKPWKPTKSDRLTVYMNVLTSSGLIVAPVRRSRERSLLGRYNIALSRWRRGEPGADAELATFESQTVGGQLLLTDATKLAALEGDEQFGFEELYASFGGGA